jgi:hypothetical protein
MRGESHENHEGEGNQEFGEEPARHESPPKDAIRQSESIEAKVESGK